MIYHEQYAPNPASVAELREGGGKWMNSTTKPRFFRWIHIVFRIPIEGDQGETK